MGESLEAREKRLSDMADRKGYTLEKHGAGSPITTLDYSLVEKETFSIVVDCSLQSRKSAGDAPPRGPAAALMESIATRRSANPIAPIAPICGCSGS